MPSHARSPYDGVKRALDIVSATVGLAVLSPVLGSVALLVAVKLGRPVLFMQDRPGKDGKIFRIYKFRTMKDPDPLRGLVSDADRLTAFGIALRATSLDELPALFNVVRGDMSVVGPRPLLVRYLDRYTPLQARRHEVRPGITGLAQVSGRNSLTWEQKFALDVEYVDSRSLLLDAQVLWKTVSVVLGRGGISGEGHATTADFTGEPGT